MIDNALVLTWWASFWADPRTQTLLGLVVVNLVVGVIAALATRTFNARRLGDWYAHTLIPYLLGYLLIWSGGELGIASLLGPIWGEVVATFGVAPAAALVARITINVAAFRASQVPDPLVAHLEQPRRPGEPPDVPV
jgi:hypothetical protein